MRGHQTHRNCRKPYLGVYRDSTICFAELHLTWDDSALLYVVRRMSRIHQIRAYDEAVWLSPVSRSAVNVSSDTELLHGFARSLYNELQGYAQSHMLAPNS